MMKLASLELMLSDVVKNQKSEGESSGLWAYIGFWNETVLMELRIHW